MEQLIKSIKTVYVDVNETQLRPQSHLGDLPGWDSMSAINLEMEIETSLGKENLKLNLKGEMTLAEVQALIQRSQI